VSFKKFIPSGRSLLILQIKQFMNHRRWSPTHGIKVINSSGKKLRTMNWKVLIHNANL